jgi:hypothetical protein
LRGAFREARGKLREVETHFANGVTKISNSAAHFANCAAKISNSPARFTNCAANFAKSVTAQSSAPGPAAARVAKSGTPTL